ncbi:acyl-CoA thioesterase [Arhodomonas aquaeolei]|uniref:acyl-CoA thioesterase n=1 Tax=Arhodomonas aquaeolei TaxID=2369 RepID=UPI0003784730|nr:thioesterase family protein [Arhodomonas aquaeolei]
MARLKLPLPERFAFCHELDVRVTDLNFGGHMGNEMVLVYAQEARAALLRHHGYSESDIEGLGIIVADAVVVFRAEAFANDPLRIHVALDDFNRYGCDILYRLEHAGDGHEIARAKTGIVFFDYSERRIARAPQAFVERFAPAGE